MMAVAAPRQSGPEPCAAGSAAGWQEGGGMPPGRPAAHVSAGVAHPVVPLAVQRAAAAASALCDPPPVAAASLLLSVAAIIWPPFCIKSHGAAVVHPAALGGVMVCKRSMPP